MPRIALRSGTTFPTIFPDEELREWVQGLQAIQHHELNGPVGTIYGEALEKVKKALRYSMDL